ncbi:hypothetical protein ACIRXL_09820 [Avibacterium paragallinarum]|uniref:hypothetical protein n=1 Tax=Avibacterium paragallinarum TaxID=728 RepID=UPI00397D6B07
MFKKSLLPVLMCSTLLAACDSSSDANEKNFKAAIQAYIDGENYDDVQVCIPKDGAIGGSVAEAISKLNTMLKNEEFREQFKKLPKKEQNKQLDAIDNLYEKVKNKTDDDLLISELNISKEGKNALINTGILTEYKFTFMGNKTFYFTTEKMRKKLYRDKNDKHKFFFCSKGKFAVDKIIDFTKPSEFFGRTITDVTYTVKANFVDDWANSKEIQEAFKASFDKVGRQYYKNTERWDYDGKPFSIRLTLTNKGWKK